MCIHNIYMGRKPVQLPPHVHQELTEIKKEIDAQYGFGLAYWETISYLIRFYKQHSKKPNQHGSTK